MPSEAIQEEEEQDESPEFWLDCRTPEPKTLLNLLQSLESSGSLSSYSSKSSSEATWTFYPSEGTLTIYTQPNPQFQSTLEIPATLFEKYQVAGADDSIFCVSSKTLLQCLQVLTLENPMGLSFQYHGPSEVLKLEAQLAKGGIASAALTGLVPPTPDTASSLSQVFTETPLQARLLMPSAHWSGCQELSWVGGVQTITLRCEPQQLCLEVQGHSSQCQVRLQVPMEVVSKQRQPGREDATLHSCQYQYPFASFERAIQCWELAHETCLSINQRGILAIQHQIIVPTSASDQQQQVFCDCLLLPLASMDDEDEEVRANASTTTTSGRTTMTQTTSALSQHYGRRTVEFTQLSETSSPAVPPSLGTQDESTFSLSRHCSRRRPRPHSVASQSEVYGEEDQSTIATQRSAPSMTYPKLSHHGHDSDSASDDSSATEVPVSTLPAQPLSFGARGGGGVGGGRSSLDSSTSQQQQRRQRQRRRSSGGGSSSVTPPSTLQQQPSSSQNLLCPQASTQDDKESEPEITYCSSPEVVYGDS